MKLLHITATHLRLAGGIPVVLRDLVEAQNNIDGFEARVLSIKADPVEMKSQYFDTLGGDRFTDYIDRFSPDVVIFHSHYYFDYMRLYKYLVKKQIPYFIEPHGSFGKAALQKSKYKKMIANEVVLRSFMHHAKGYIFLNESEKQDSHYFTENDLIIPNGINEEEVKTQINTDDKSFIYFIGRFDINHKGLDYLFDALDILDENGELSIPLKLYGKGTEEEVKYINSRISTYRTINVENCGAIYGDEQSRNLEQCGIMILTSRYEGFPMTVLEAWKYGNPCIVTPGTNVYSEVKDNDLGWVSGLSASNIAEVVLQAEKDYKRFRENYIKRCKDYVLKWYSWRRVAELSYKSISRYIKE